MRSPAVLLLPNDPASFAPLSRSLEEAGHPVHSFLPPYPGSEGGKDAERDCLRAVRERFLCLRNAYGDVAVLGISQGAVPALLLAEMYAAFAVVALNASLFPKREDRRSRLARMADRDLFAVSCPILTVTCPPNDPRFLKSARRILTGVTSRVREEFTLPDRAENGDALARRILSFLRAAPDRGAISPI